MSLDMDIQGDALLIRALTAAPVRQAIESGALGIAAEGQDRTAPYPREPRRRPNAPYYVRGTGLFTPGGILIRRSETMNRRWNIRSVAFGAILENRASYSGRVKGGRGQQASHHRRTGWTRTIDDVAGVVRDGTAASIMGAALRAALPGGED